MSVSQNIRIANAQNNNTPYDEVQYPSMPFSLTIPTYIGAIAKLFGMTPADPKKARVLEMGCAAGGNIIPLAGMYPDAEFVGIDLSSKQIAEGKNIIEGVGYKNIKLHSMSITDLDESFGKFDYIIVHGIYSWVPEFVRDKILENGKKLLAPNGVFYVSYNVAPGWNMVKSIRDLMLYHTSSFPNPADKFNQAKLVLQFIHDSIKGDNSPYATLLGREIDVLKDKDAGYVLHDHMEEENYHPYFHEFADHAKKYKLQYLGDANISTMFLGNYKKEVVETLGQVNDIVKQEQYMDFVSNRRFRSTLLCHNNVPLTRNLSQEQLSDLYISITVIPEKNLSDVDLNSNEELKFFIDRTKETHLSSTSPSIKACFYGISQTGASTFTLDEIYKEAKSIYSKFNKNDFEKELQNLLFRLILAGRVHLYLDRPYNILKKVSDKPKLWSLAYFQARSLPYNFVTSQGHLKIDVQLFDKVLMTFLDGTNTVEDIKEKMLEEFKKGTLKANLGDRTLEMSELEPELVNWIKAYLEVFRYNNLLIA